jgi:signal peptidase I
MEPTFKNGDKILIFKYAYRFSEPQRGDIVLVKAEDKVFVKRIIALPGEKIEIADGKVKINDEILYESYVKEIHTYGDQRVFLQDKQYFVLGDNREPNKSIDSRELGPITRKNILGKVIATFSPEFKLLKKQLFKLGS